VPDASRSSKATPVDRVLQLLTAVAQHGEPVSAKRLADLTRLPSSSLYRHLASLRRWGFIEESEREGCYEPGPICLQLSSAGRSARLASVARGEIEQLVAQTGESAGLMVTVNAQIVCLDMVESPQSLRCSFRRGAKLPLSRGASARAQLAFLAKREWRDVRKSHFAQVNDVALRALEEDLEQIRRRGYAVSESEVDPGVWGVSVPLLNRSNRLLGGLSLMAPVSRASGKHQALIQATVAAAGRIAGKF
jgi:DNA-binding IclR family transcriptional regulator